VAFLFGPNQAGVSSIDSAGTITQAQLQGPLAGNMTEFLAALNRGDLYVNVHSLEHPAGVVRGQIPAGTATPSAPATGTGSATTGGGMSTSTTMALAGAAVTAAAAMGWAIRRRPGTRS
jgi:hypothetical protein